MLQALLRSAWGTLAALIVGIAIGVIWSRLVIRTFKRERWDTAYRLKRADEQLAEAEALLAEARRRDADSSSRTP